MEIQQDRVIVYPADIQRWYGNRKRGAYLKYRKIKLELGVPVNRPLTIFHLRDYFGISLEDIVKRLFA